MINFILPIFLTPQILFKSQQIIKRVEYQPMRSQYTESQADIGIAAKASDRPGKNTFVFGILVILMQIAICLLYAFLVWLPPYDFVDPVGPVDFTPIIITVLLFFMVVLGFGPLFAYLRKLVWSAVGFNLLIVCLTIQWFFLIYLFWFKCNIRGYGVTFSSGIAYNNIWLTNSMYIKDPNNSQNLISAIGACLTQALKCALANCIGFSAILGRAGPLECFFVALFGTIGYELNRNIVEYVYWDYGGTYEVFCYGGFMSLMIGILVRCKEKGIRETAKHLKYTGSLYAGAISFFGATMLFAVFPVLTADPEMPWFTGTTPTINEMTTFSNSMFFRTPFAIWYCMAASVMVGMAVSIFVFAKLVVRDMLNSLIAGGVACCTAGAYFTNPVWAMVLGSTCGLVQSLVQGLIQKKVAMNSNIFHTFSFTLFGVQGIIGGIFASIFRAVVVTRNDSFTFTFDYIKAAGYDLAMALLSAAFGIAFGILIGVFALITSSHEKIDYFNDYTYWVPDDGIRYPQVVIPAPDYIPAPVIPEGEIYVKETVVNVKAKHAYL